MKSFFTAIAVLAVFAVPAQAGILSNLLTFNGEEDRLLDQSVDGIWDEGDGEIGLGDVLYGIAQIDQYALDGGANVNLAPPRVAIAVAAQITSYDVSINTPGIATARIGFGAVTAQDMRLTDLLGTGFTGTLDGSSLFGVFESDSATPLPINFVNGDDGSGKPTGLTNFTTTDWDFVAEGGIATGVDFFQAEIQTFLTGANAGKIRSAIQVGGLSITNHAFGGDTIFLPVAVTDLDGSDSDHDIVFDGSIKDSTGNALDNGWAYQNDATYTLNAVVPEPASLLTFAGLAGFGLLVRRRK